jgi:glycosyltransferase involved in cell wall biosynthesis
MKIVFCKSGFAGPISGADEIAVTYAVELKAAGHTTEVLLVHPPMSDDPLVARLRAADVPLVTLASPLFTASFGAARKLAIRAMRICSPASNLIRSNSRKVVFDLLQRYHDACCAYLKRNRPDVLHVLTPDQGAVMLIRAAHDSGEPVVYQEVGIPYHPPGFEEVYKRFVTVLPLCAGVAVLSPLLAQEVIRVLPQVATPYVLPLMSQDTLNGSPRNGDRAESICFGFAGRLEYLKGPLELIEAFGLAHKVLLGLELKIAGAGSQRQEIYSARRRLNL